MAKQGKGGISWTDETWNPIRARLGDKIWFHCEHVSEACRNCYAEVMNKRFGTGLDYKPGTRDKAGHFLDEKTLLAPLGWRKPRKIFVCSTTDLFGDWVEKNWIDNIFSIMALCPQHTFQVLTKRPARMRAIVSRMVDLSRAATFDGISIADEFPHITTSIAHPQGLKAWPLPNVWLGVTAESQASFNARWAILREIPAAVIFVSMEPLLGEILFRPAKPDWIIAGSESGPHARRCKIEWVRSLNDQCVAAGVPFFWKQHFENKKKITLPALDGKRWAEFPR